MKKLIVLLLAAVCISQHTTAVEPGITRQIDSLCALLPAAEGEARLELYLQLESPYISLGDAKQGEAFYRDFVAEAHRQGDIHREGYGSAPGGLTFTDKVSGKSIFLPAAGYRDSSDGELDSDADTDRYYWIATGMPQTNYQGAWHLYFCGDELNPLNYAGRGEAFSVRCVRK